MTTEIGVLVVDDDQTARHLLHEVMAREGYRVEAAETGREAIEKAGAASSMSFFLTSECRTGMAWRSSGL
jgi:CheY-like chemotaxis protein